MPLVLVIENEKPVRDAVAASLESLGGEGGRVARIQGVESLKEAAKALRKARPDLVILDILLPDGDGLVFYRDHLKSQGVPAIALTVMHADSVQISAFRHYGVDDFLAKPFRPEILAARAYRLLAKGASIADNRTTGDATALEVDAAGNRILLRGIPVPLAGKKPYDLLRALIEAGLGRILTRDQLLDALHGDGNAPTTDRSIDAHIKRIRKALREIDPEWDGLETVHGMGYRLK